MQSRQRDGVGLRFVTSWVSICRTFRMRGLHPRHTNSERHATLAYPRMAGQGVTPHMRACHLGHTPTTRVKPQHRQGSTHRHAQPRISHTREPDTPRRTLSQAGNSPTHGNHSPLSPIPITGHAERFQSPAPIFPSLPAHTIGDAPSAANRACPQRSARNSITLAAPPHAHAKHSMIPSKAG